MARKSTIGTNPLDAVVPVARPVRRKEPEPELPKKERVTVLLPEDVLERARTACYWTPALTMAELVERALTAEIERLERKRGEAFPPREGRLRTGRPQKR